MFAISSSSSLLDSNAWKPLFKRHIDLLSPTAGTPEFSLATISPPDASSYSGFPFPTPRVRTLMFRGFWLEQPPNDKNPYWARFNSHVRQGQQSNSGLRWESEVLTFATNAETHKVCELFYSPACASGGGQALDILSARGVANAGAKVSESADTGRVMQTGTSGGGAYVEACFWAKGTDTQTQWRIRGRCYILALEDIDDLSLPHIRELYRRIEQRVRVQGTSLLEGTSLGWSYHQEVLAHFANLSPLLRASFVPGTGQVTEGYCRGEPLPQGLHLPENVVPLDNDEAVPAEYGGNGSSRGEAARRNFRVGVILPEIVDRLDLSERGGAGKRWVHRLEGDGDGKKEPERWIETEVWP